MLILLSHKEEIVVERHYISLSVILISKIKHAKSHGYTTLTKEHSNVSQNKHDHQQQDSNQQSSNQQITNNNNFPALFPSSFPAHYVYV